MFHKLGWLGRQGNHGSSDGPVPHSSNSPSEFKIPLEPADMTRTLSSGKGRLSPWGGVDKRRLGVSLMWKRVSGTREERSESAQNSSRQDSGAAIVEMAFIFSILVMLLVGVTTSAIAFGQKNSIENAAREASRFAATLPPDPDINDAWLDKVRNVAREAAQGNLEASVDGQYICVAHIGVSGIQSTLVQNGGAPTYPDTLCYADGLSDSRVQVVTGRDAKINAALFSVDVSLDAKNTARYEREE